MKFNNKNINICVVGLGYVGLPLALELSKHFKTVGFDIDTDKVSKLKKGIDVNKEGLDQALKETELSITDDISIAAKCNFYIIGVPTPVDENNNPDLKAVISASRSVGQVLSKGDTVVYESTVYPGVTEEICALELEKVSSLKSGVDFKLGYSPERMNPGDVEHSLSHVIKVVSGQDAETLELVAHVYSSVVKAGVHKAPSIKVAEAAKVIENTQRDLNIALMNELAIIFDLMNISTRDVLAAAATKWNFNKYSPGLVGGHCIGVDPYYLTTKAEQLSYHPQVILAGRRINDGMGAFIAQKLIKLMVNKNIQIKNSKVAILGITFKENVTDVRNSKVPDIVKELITFGINPLIHDPMADKAHVYHEYGLDLVSYDELSNLDAIIYAVPHKFYQELKIENLTAKLNKEAVLIDVKSKLDPAMLEDSITYWSL